MITIAPKSSIIARAVKKTFREIGTLFPNRDNTPNDGQTIISGQIYSGNENETTSNPCMMAFSTKSGTAPYTLTERMRISSTGNVGIGVTNPTTALHVHGAGTDGGEVFRITSTGDVADAGYHWMSSAMAPSQSTNASMIHLIGVAESVRNSGYIGFHYVLPGA